MPSTFVAAIRPVIVSRALPCGAVGTALASASGSLTTDAAGAAGVYAAPEDLRTDEVNVLERVAGAPAVVTDGAFLWDGRLALRTYTAVHVSAALGAPAEVLTLPRTVQGESLAVAPGNRAVLVGSEGVASPVYRQPLPD